MNRDVNRFVPFFVPYVQNVTQDFDVIKDVVYHQQGVEDLVWYWVGSINTVICQFIWFIVCNIISLCCWVSAVFTKLRNEHPNVSVVFLIYSLDCITGTGVCVMCNAQELWSMVLSMLSSIVTANS